MPSSLSWEEQAEALGLSPASLREKLEEARAVLYPLRSQRPAPLLDDKILSSWNGLMISAFAQAGWLLREPAHLSRAERAASFLLEELVVEGRLRRSYRQGLAPHGAARDSLIAGSRPLRGHRKRMLAREALRPTRWWSNPTDSSGGGWWRTPARLLPERKVTTTEDSAGPVQLMNLLRLHAPHGCGSLPTASRLLVCARLGSVSRPPSRRPCWR